MLSKSIPLLRRLTSIRPSALHLLILGHARAQLDIHPRRRRKSKTLGHLYQIKLVHIKDTTQRVTGVGMQIRSVAVFGRLVKVVVFANELFQLRLDIEDLGSRELEFDDGNARGFEVRKEAYFGRLQEHERTAFGVGAAGGAADAVDVVARVIWGVELDDPVHGGDL